MSEKITANEELKFTDSNGKDKAVLGILEGPCADFMSATRNGRKYNESLWEKVFNSPIVNELLLNGGIPGELDHPSDRSETDSTKIAILMQEKPKKKNGELWSKFSILNTPCGLIAYTLAKAGFKFGISSRGEGDVYTDYDGSETVDEDTYDFKGFDLVLIPAVKAARLNLVTEGLNNTFNYKKALKESLRSASEEDRKIMENTLNNLNIVLSESIRYKNYDIQIGDSDVFVRDNSGEVVCKFPTEEEAMEYIDSINESLEENDIDADNESAENIDILQDAPELVEDEDTIHEYDFENEQSIKDCFNDVSSLLDNIELEDDNDDDFIEILTEVSRKLQSMLDKYLTTSGEIPDDILVTTDDDKASDAGLELVELLQDALASKSNLLKQLVLLQEKLSVCYTKEAESKELIGKLMSTINRLKESYNEITSLRQTVQKLLKLINSMDSDFAKKEESLKSLNENLDDNNIKLAKANDYIELLKTANSNLISTNKKLQENYKNLQSSSTTDKDSLNESLAEARNDLIIKTKNYTQKLDQQQKLTEKYKTIAKKAVDKYISLQSLMIGVSSQEIKSRLKENYSFNDIDKICEDLRDYKVNMSRLPFNMDLSSNKKAKINFNESFKDRLAPPNDADIVDELLLRIADLN